METNDPKKTENNSINNKLKWLIGILAVLLLSLGIYTATLVTDSQKAQERLTIEKLEVEEDLQELLVSYNQAIEESSVKDNELIAARQRIQGLLDSLKSADADRDLLRRYKSELGKLKTERDYLVKRVDSLQYVAQRFEYERDSTSVVLEETIREVDSIKIQNEALETIVTKGQALKLSKLSGEGVKVRNNGKIVSRNRASQIDKLRTCFTINANEIAEKGDKLLFIQVINPRNNVLGEQSTVSFEDKVLTYSATSNVFYENEELDVCVLVNASEEDLVSGIYQINVFDGPRLVANSSLELK
jgi:hypothetical protein